MVSTSAQVLSAMNFPSAQRTNMMRLLLQSTLSFGAFSLEVKPGWPSTASPNPPRAWSLVSERALSLSARPCALPVTGQALNKYLWVRQRLGLRRGAPLRLTRAFLKQTATLRRKTAEATWARTTHTPTPAQRTPCLVPLLPRRKDTQVPVQGGTWAFQRRSLTCPRPPGQRHEQHLKQEGCSGST